MIFVFLFLFLSIFLSVLVFEVLLLYLKLFYFISFFLNLPRLVFRNFILSNPPHFNHNTHFYHHQQSQRRLNETYGGGMGSFVLVTIIISFLQMRFKNLAYRKVQQSWNLGGLLLEFFVLYGNTFNYVHTGISISKGGFYFEKLCRAGWFNPVRWVDV